VRSPPRAGGRAAVPSRGKTAFVKKLARRTLHWKRLYPRAPPKLLPLRVLKALRALEIRPMRREGNLGKNAVNRGRLATLWKRRAGRRPGGSGPRAQPSTILRTTLTARCFRGPLAADGPKIGGVGDVHQSAKRVWGVWVFACSRRPKERGRGASSARAAGLVRVAVHALRKACPRSGSPSKKIREHRASGRDAALRRPSRAFSACGPCDRPPGLRFFPAQRPPGGHAPRPPTPTSDECNGPLAARRFRPGVP